jgi:hypothetical protein
MAGFQMSTEAKEIVDKELAHYKSHPKFTAEWIDRIENLAIASLMGMLPSGTRPFENYLHPALKDALKLDRPEDNKPVVLRRGYRKEVRVWMQRNEISSVKEAAKRLAISDSILKSIMANVGKKKYSPETLAGVLAICANSEHYLRLARVLCPRVVFKEHSTNESLMGLTASRQIDRRKRTHNSAVQSWDADLSKVYINLFAPMRSRQRASIYDWKI